MPRRLKLREQFVTSNYRKKIASRLLQLITVAGLQHLSGHVRFSGHDPHQNRAERHVNRRMRVIN